MYYDETVKYVNLIPEQKQVLSNFIKDGLQTDFGGGADMWLFLILHHKYKSFDGNFFSNGISPLGLGFYKKDLQGEGLNLFVPDAPEEPEEKNSQD
jgi:hypothetical protein